MIDKVAHRIDAGRAQHEVVDETTIHLADIGQHTASAQCVLTEAPQEAGCQQVRVRIPLSIIDFFFTLAYEWRIRYDAADDGDHQHGPQAFEDGLALSISCYEVGVLQSWLRPMPGEEQKAFHSLDAAKDDPGSCVGAKMGRCTKVYEDEILHAL